MSDRMPKADLNKLSARDREFIERVSRENQIRVARLQRVRRNNLFTLGALCSIVVGIYGYTIYAVKQETFLDDFEQPAKIIEKPHKL